jgi:competence protein ComEA
MSNLSSKVSVALAAVIVVVSCALGWTLIRMAQSSAAPGVTLHEAFAQPPGGVPPGPPPVVPANAPSAESIATGTSGSAASSNAAGQDTSDGRTASVSTPAGVTPVATPSSSEVVVHVAGAVHTPGVYHLPVGARNDEAIKKAGGPTAEANTDGINLAARVEDGSQLFLPTHKQHPEGGADAPTDAAGAVSSAAGSKSSGKAGVKGVTKSAGVKGSGKSGKLNDPTQGKVNINTASVEELQRLPGIGPAMAERISEFRKQGGKFTAPEDLLQISGIGEKKFARMQPFVKVR